MMLDAEIVDTEGDHLKFNNFYDKARAQDSSKDRMFVLDTVI